MFSVGFRSGALPMSLRVKGLYCPNKEDQRSYNEVCEVCTRACQSFPVQDVATFHSGGSLGHLENGDPYSLDVCLKRDALVSAMYDEASNTFAKQISNHSE
eukprot:scaffold4792_cov31-Cyclotella_meneghiniana.AAC.3